MTSTTRAQRVAERIQTHTGNRRQVVMTMGRYSPKSQSIIMVTNPPDNAESIGYHQTRQRLVNAAAATAQETHTIVQVDILRKALVALLSATTMICMPFGAVLAAILRPGVTPELFIWTIYAAISGAIIGVGTIIYLRKTLLQTGITTLAILPDFQDQEHFDSTFSAYSDDQHYVAIEPYTNHGNHAATKRRKRRR